MGLFDELDANTLEPRETIIKAPFSYPGSKSRSVKFILPHLPLRHTWVDVFGGSGVITINRPKSKLEVYNDRHSGVTDFYRCMRDRSLFDRLCAWLDLTLHSREEFLANRDTWENIQDPVERAGRWFSMVNYSFGSLGRNWGRSTGGTGGLSGKIRNGIRNLPEIHERFKCVQVENADWRRILKDYDSCETVFYMDPPYVDSSTGVYEYEMSDRDHREMLETVFTLKGFVAMSGYANPLYDKQPWDKRFSWDVRMTAKAMAFHTENNKEHQDESRGRVEEKLWIKESNAH
jgi:DNA adenine methylase